MQKHKHHNPRFKNPLETQSGTDGATSIIRDIEQQKKIFEEKVASEGLLGTKERTSPNPEFTTIFDLHKHTEQIENPRKIRELQEQVSQLTSQIRSEVATIKSNSDGLVSEAEAIQKVTLESLPEKPGIYHIRYLEILLSFLKGIKAKVGEAKTWLAAMQSKKAKRGSAFVSQSKKKGTQYSMSQELQTARNVQ